MPPIGYKIHDRHWKTIQSSIPTKSISEIKAHAVLFFNKLQKIAPARISMLEFVRSKPLELLKNVYFQLSDSDCSEEQDEEEKGPEKHKFITADMPMINPIFPVPIAASKPKYVSTQSCVISDTLKKITLEMIKLLQNLTSDIKGREGEIEKDSNVSGYWGYIYNSAIYLQQMINDVTVVHNSTLACSQDGGNKRSDQSESNNSAK